MEGFFDQAASILRALWKADCTATISKHQVRMGLEFIWSATSFRFPGIGWLPSSPLMLSTLEIGHRQRLFPVTSSETISHCRSQFRTHPGSVSRWNLVRALVGVRYLNPNTTRTQMPPPKDEAEALHLLHEYLSAPPSQASIDGPDHADCLALAVDLSLKYGQEDKARLYLDYAAARMADGITVSFIVFNPLYIYAIFQV